MAEINTITNCNGVQTGQNSTMNNTKNTTIVAHSGSTVTVIIQHDANSITQVTGDVTVTHDGAENTQRHHCYSQTHHAYALQEATSVCEGAVAPKQTGVDTNKMPMNPGDWVDVCVRDPDDWLTCVAFGIYTGDNQLVSVSTQGGEVTETEIDHKTYLYYKKTLSEEYLYEEENVVNQARDKIGVCYEYGPAFVEDVVQGAIKSYDTYKRSVGVGDWVQICEYQTDGWLEVSGFAVCVDDDNLVYLSAQGGMVTQIKMDKQKNMYHKNQVYSDKCQRQKKAVVQRAIDKIGTTYEYYQTFINDIIKE